MPVTDNPDLLPTESLLTDSLAAAAQLAPSNEATRLLLNTTICINPDTEAWSVKGGRHPSMAPALEVSDNDAWHFASAYRTTSRIGSSAAQVKPVHLLCGGSNHCGGLNLGWEAVITSWAAGNGCRGVSLEVNHVWHPWDKYEAHHSEYKSEDPEVTTEHSWWIPSKLPERVCGVARAATTSIASIVDSSSPLSDAQLLSLR